MAPRFTFEDELRSRVEGAFDFSPPGPALAEKLRLAARTACVNHGMMDAKVVVKIAGRSMIVEVIPPPRAPHVSKVVLEIGRG
jgi:hypothetical protein